MAKAVYFVVNPIAGGGKRNRKLVEDLCANLGGIRYQIYETTMRGDGVRASQQAVAEGYRTVVAVGGDGTVNEVATGIYGSEAALAIMPMGSGNGLARALKIPFRPHAALNVALHGETLPIDMGRAGDRMFCAVSGVGFDATVADRFDRAKSRGFLTYCAVTAREVFRYSPQEYSLEIGKDVFSCRPFFMTAANSPQFGNGAVIAPHAKIDDGYLDLCIVDPMSHLQLIGALPRLFLGSIDKHPKIHYRRVKSLLIRFDSPIQYHVDGEPVQTGNELRIDVLPHVLRVKVPVLTIPEREPAALAAFGEA